MPRFDGTGPMGVKAMTGRGFGPKGKKYRDGKEDFMKIAIPVDTNNMETTLCTSFGRAPYYLIYDMEKQQGNFLVNTAANSAGGAGIKAAQIIVDSKADILLTPRCGENAAEVLQVGNINIYKTNGISAKENIEAFRDGKLSLLDEIHSGFHGHRGN